MKGRINKLFTITITTASLIFSMAGCGNKDTKTAKEAKNVKTVEVTSGPIGLEVEYAAKLKAFESAEIVPKVPGKVKEIKVAVGQEVKKGDVLFTLDDAEAKAQYNQSVAAVENAAVNLNKISDSDIVTSIEALEAAQKSAQIQYDDAKKYYTRVNSLYQAGAVSKQEFEDAESKFNSAEIALNSANTKLQILKDKSAPQSIEAAAAQVRQAQATADLSSTQVSNTIITAPIDGIVAAKNINVGEMASSAVTAVSVMNSKTLTAEVYVPDSIVKKVNKGDSVSVKVNALEDKKFNGIVESVSPGTDEKTKLYTIKVTIDNKDGLIKADMFTKVAFVVEKKENANIVPKEALIVENGVQYVFVVENGVVKKKVVKPGIYSDTLVDVGDSLKVKEKVIVEGQSFLNEGEKVNFVI